MVSLARTAAGQATIADFQQRKSLPRQCLFTERRQDLQEQLFLKGKTQLFLCLIRWLQHRAMYTSSTSSAISCTRMRSRAYRHSLQIPSSPCCIVLPNYITQSKQYLRSTSAKALLSCRKKTTLLHYKPTPAPSALCKPSSNQNQPRGIRLFFGPHSSWVSSK